MSRYALVIGSQIEGLTGVEHDTFRMRDTLRARGFAVDLRFGDTATRDGILDGYDALIARSAAGDAAVIYYSGHGLYSTNSDPGDPLRIVQSIAPTDLRCGGDTDFRGITAWELAIKLAQLTAKTRNATVILDCCHAALMTRDAAAHGVVPRALPHPVRMGFRAHLAALERAYGEVALDPVGNPDAVRVVACGQTEPAFEHTNPAGRRAGVFTEALLEILHGVGDAPISWAAIGDAIRERVMRRFVLQRPDVEGPSERQLFSLAVEPRRGAVPVTRDGEQFRLQVGWVTGASAGDVYGAMPLGAQVYDDARAIARLRIADAGPVTSIATLEHWHDGQAALPDDAVAVPIELTAPRYPVAVIASDAERTAIARAIAATRTLRLAARPEDALGGAPDAAPGTAPTTAPGTTPGTTATTAPTTAPTTAINDAVPLATLRLTGDQLTIEDLAGPVFPPSRYPDGLADAIQDVVNLGVAQGVRALIGEHGLSAVGLPIAWGVVAAGAPREMPEHGAALGLDDRIYVSVTNTGALLRYVHVCNVGVRGKVTLLTKHRAPAGIALRGGEAITLGEHNGRLVGLPLAWPDGLSRDGAPRLDELFVFVAAQPISLRSLETHEHHEHATRGGLGTGSKLRGPPGQLRDAAPRSVAGPAPREAFFVKRLSFILDPTQRTMSDFKK